VVSRVKKLRGRPPQRLVRTDPVAQRNRWIGLAAICGATFMLLVDVTIVQVALPTIQRDFHTSFTVLQWVINAYALSLSALILTSGSLADRFGRKAVFVLGVCTFTFSSFMCGVATGPLFLELSRALQGVGGAAMFATSLALIGQEFHGTDRARAIGIWGATIGGAVAIGPLVGGAITSAIGWRWIFFVNVPIGIATTALALRLLVNRSDPDADAVDLAGLVLFTSALFLLNFALLEGTSKGWGDVLIVATLLGAAVALGVFVAVELRSSHPMFDMSLFRNPGFCGVSMGTFAIGMGMFALLPYLTLYLQDQLGYSPLSGGLRMLPATLLTFAVPLATRRLAERMPPGIVLGGGLLVCAAGIAAMHGISVSSGWTALLPGFILIGVGIGVANPAIATIGLGVVHPARTGMASGISNSMRISGLATGIAALGAAFQARISSEVHHLAPGAPGSLADTIASGGRQAAGQLALRLPLGRSVYQVASRSFVAAMNELFVIGAAILVVGALASFGLVRAAHIHSANRPIQEVRIEDGVAENAELMAAQRPG
jgi:EmrB/QacA subfamily drug resistance transporter